MRFDKRFIIEAVPGAMFLSDVFPEQINFSIDSRTLQPGDIFIALKGDHFNGNNFIVQALEKKAAGIICEADGQDYIKKYAENKHLAKLLVVVVPDTLDAIISMARCWRTKFTYPVIAVTGSVGKTTTKELISHILSSHGGRYLATKGNQNTMLGVALNMLKMSCEHQGAIFEIGIDRRGQMRRKAALVNPTLAIITAIGHNHMEGLGSLADIAAEKRDIFSSFKEDNIGIINGDQKYLAQVGYRHPVLKFGTKTSNQIQARKVSSQEMQTSFVLKLYRQKFHVTLPTSHPGVIQNTLAAVSVAHLLEVPIAMIIEAIENSPGVPQRFEMRSLRNNRGNLIDDCYNASPESVKAALLTFQNIKTSGKKIAIIGDMLELGADSAFWHRQVGRFLRKASSLDGLVLVGKQVEWIKATAPVGISVEHVSCWEDAVSKVEQLLTVPESLILVKGSHGIQLHNLVKRLEEL